MNDGPVSHSSNAPAGHPDRVTMRASRLQHLEQLLGNIAQHLHATGNRHSDVVTQLQERLRYLHQTTLAGGAAPDVDRHLALFEAQLTSLAIRTGVPTPTAPPIVATTAAPQQPPLQSNNFPPASAAQRLPEPRPVATQSGVEGLAPNASPALVNQTVAEALQRPIGAPPPAAPPADRPGLDALTRRSELTFEDAVAADQAEKADAARLELGAASEDHIFAYQPPGTKPSTPAQDASPTEPAPVHASTEFTPVDPQIGHSVEAVIETEPAANMADVIVDERRATPIEPVEFQSPVEQVAPIDQIEPDAEPVASASSLRSELEAALSGDTHPVPEPVAPSDTCNAVAPEDSIAEVAASADSAESNGAVAAAIDEDVRNEIDRLSRQIKDITTSVEKLEASLQQSREDVPNLIEQAASAAATQVADQFKANDQDHSRRISELQEMLDDRFSERTEPAAPPQQVEPTRAHPADADLVSESRLEQARQSMLGRLAPVGNVINRRTKREGGTREAALPVATHETAHTKATQAQADAAALQSAERLNEVAPDPVHAQEQMDLSAQSISSLRKSLFQSLKEGSPPALIIVFAIAALLSGALLWNLASDGSPNQTVASAEQVTKGTRHPADADPDITNSTSSLSELAANGIHTTGTVRPTASDDGRLENDNPPFKPTALRPETGLPIDSSAATGGSKLELPPLATGPLSLRMAAAGGDPAAQFEVGSRLAQGNGVTRDPIAAVKWYTRAASAGHARAQYRLAALYERGAGVATDTGRAKIWYTRAAQQGNVKAMHNLAVLYAGQAGGTPNYVNAAQWFERAAEHGLADSQFNVAILYQNGLGVTKNLRTAYKWFSLASKQGDQEATRRLKGVSAQLSASERAAAMNVVNSWRAKPAPDEANKAVAWQPKSTSRKVAPAAARQSTLQSPKTAAPSGVIGAREIKKIQRLLNGLGYDVGSPDGRVGGKTKTSIKSFQTRNGMIPTGIVDQALISRIEAATREKAAKLGQI